jgi:hypothetical protein
MNATTITLPQDYESGKKPWAARITGRDPKYNYAREFLASPIATQPGLYVTSADPGRKGRDPKQRYYLVMLDDEAGLVRTGSLSDESVAEIVDHYIGRIDRIVPQGRPEGKLFYYWKRDGKVVLRDNRSDLLAERARLVTRLAEIDAQLDVDSRAKQIEVV